MKRNATLNLEEFDPEVLDAARDVARRAGVPVEAWIASIVSPDQKPKARRSRTSSSTHHLARPRPEGQVPSPVPPSPVETAAVPEPSPVVDAAAAPESSQEAEPA
ncbi:hypothetical protein, partial [Methylobacterium sp. WL19]|uniref:hypothetical protein n=1 Tax=Methylobacterium sp. WL19 TaxID=2603896 RepID=UPI00164F6B3C